MHTLPSREDELARYAGLLREALTGLVEAIEHPLPAVWGLDDLTWRVDYAKQLLTMETGRHAQAEWLNAVNLNSEGYLLADYVHFQLYGEARAPSGSIPIEAEVKEALAAIQRLTEEAWALEDLRLPQAARLAPGGAVRGEGDV